MSPLRIQSTYRRVSPFTRTCRKCAEPFVLIPHKPGHIDDCYNCLTEHCVTYVAKVAHTSKNSSLAEIEFTKDHKDARSFNGKQRRLGAGVTACLVESKSEFVPFGRRDE